MGIEARLANLERQAPATTLVVWLQRFASRPDYSKVHLPSTGRTIELGKECTEAEVEAMLASSFPSQVCAVSWGSL
jgi:hypothetical protein